MLLQTLRSGAAHDFAVLSQTRLYDSPAATSGRYRGALQGVLGAFFEKNAETLRPRREFAAGDKAVPDTVRMLDDEGHVVASYTTRDLACDTGLALAPLA